jgi:hypothetical protein
VLKNGVGTLTVGITSFFNFYTKLFFINKQFRTCTNAFPNEFTVRSYEYWAGQHWILSWMEGNQTVTFSFILGYLRMILWKISTAVILLAFFKTTPTLFFGENIYITSQLFIEVPVPSQESGRSCICMLGVSILPLSMNYLLNFRNVPTVWND